ncbi:nucleotidyl transferase AbiEii/AbiGii toxin family protein [Pseudotabrizicola alkalilacus]|uniref:Nucleotidyl transferase AbiEii/AbiGii toxin family protein n=1 Tax=Pseudotabrizicola alkalilacus TaxID=2305252 RepID=A0A411YY58_9RHOB|nr:nucleotidyl transferase AbiEii/AbiGii toxin family protein [Pseudotabrizicola alkalilacus]RGP35718.1 nucleotidyl transferase AbiEii/AbiGii toxin family protein [Pseudotabrizicola alkalilacus]
MPEDYFKLTDKDARDLLGAAALQVKRPDFLIEKDIWVVWSLNAIFSSSFSDSLVFKGGTSLSKAFHAINRFSEDLDITYNIRKLLNLEDDESDTPASRSASDKLRRRSDEALASWVEGQCMPHLQARLDEFGIGGGLIYEGGSDLRIVYPSRSQESGYVKPEVLLEFGGRSTAEPHNHHTISCDIAEHFKDISFPVAKASVMDAERTFWEKATAIYAFVVRDRLDAARQSRHWYDLMMLDDSGIANAAIQDDWLANQVAMHKSVFFRSAGVDYNAAINGAMRLVPEGEALKDLKSDYDKMISGGMIFGTPPEFDEVIQRCESISNRINRRGQPEP